MNHSYQARKHIFPTNDFSKIRVKCNCGQIDVVDTVDFVPECKHVCSQNHTDLAWFNHSAQYVPYNAYWAILRIYPGTNRQLDEEQRLALIYRRIRWQKENLK